jgi:hypothetical protein
LDVRPFAESSLVSINHDLPDVMAHNWCCMPFVCRESKIALSAFRSRLLPGLFVGLLAALWIATAERGADYRFYARWAEAGVSGDIESLGDIPRSAMSVPYSNWYAGPGMLAAPFEYAASYIGMREWGMMWAGFVAAVAFWLALWLAVRELTDAETATWGSLVAACGTPLGYYTFSVSSETLTLLPLGVLSLCFARLLRGKVAPAMAIAAATGMLLIMRPYVAVYAWPVIWLAICQQTRMPQRIGACAAIGAAIILACLEIAIVNYWMKGDPLTSAYSFGDEYFQSFDTSCPHAYAVVFDTFHGLTPNHPLVLLGVSACGVHAVLQLARRELVAAVAWWFWLLAAAVHVYFQGCWFYWWMAENSFAMRGLVPMAVPAILALSAGVARLQKGSVSVTTSWKFVLVQCTVAACCIWSGLLWNQGPMDFLNWRELTEGQLLLAKDWIFGSRVSALWAAAPFALSTAVSFGGSWLRHIVTIVCVEIVVAHLMERAEFSSASLWVVYGFGLASMATFWIAWSLPCIEERLFCSIAKSALAMFVLSLGVFARLSYFTTSCLDRQTVGYVEFNEHDTARAYKSLILLAEADNRFQCQRLHLEAFLKRTYGADWLQSAIDKALAGDEGELKLRSIKSRGLPKPLGIRKLPEPFRRDASECEDQPVRHLDARTETA